MTAGRAMQLIEHGRFAPVERPKPEPAPGEVLIRLQGCGVCASNVPPWEGRDWFTYPMEPGAPGHEAWGIIDRVGPGVETLEPGQRVATLSQQAFATHVTAPAEQAVPLPAELDGLPFPGEPLACAMNVLDRSGVKRGDTVLVVGVGFLGAMLVELCVAEGAEVTATSRRDTARPIALERGATTFWSTEEAEAEAGRVGGFFEGGRFDIVIEVTGKQSPLDLATKLVARWAASSSPGFTRTVHARSTCSSGTGAASTSSTPTSETRNATPTASAGRSTRWSPAACTSTRSSPTASPCRGSTTRWPSPVTGPTASSRRW